MRYRNLFLEMKMLLQVHSIIATSMILKLNGPRSTQVGQSQSDPIGDACKSTGAPRHEVGPWEQNKAIIWTEAPSKRSKQIDSHLLIGLYHCFHWGKDRQ